MTNTDKCYGGSFQGAKRKEKRISNLNRGWSGLWPGKALRKKWSLSWHLRNKHEVDRWTGEDKGLSLQGSQEQHYKVSKAVKWYVWLPQGLREGQTGSGKEGWEYFRVRWLRKSYSSSYHYCHHSFRPGPSLVIHVFNPFHSHFPLPLYASHGDKVF